MLVAVIIQTLFIHRQVFVLHLYLVPTFGAIPSELRELRELRWWSYVRYPR